MGSGAQNTSNVPGIAVEDDDRWGSDIPVHGTLLGSHALLPASQPSPWALHSFSVSLMGSQPTFSPEHPAAGTACCTDGLYSRPVALLSPNALAKALKSYSIVTELSERAAHGTDMPCPFDAGFEGDPA